MSALDAFSLTLTGSRVVGPLGHVPPSFSTQTTKWGEGGAEKGNSSRWSKFFTGQDKLIRMHHIKPLMTGPGVKSVTIGIMQLSFSFQVTFDVFFGI